MSLTGKLFGKDKGQEKSVSDSPKDIKNMYIYVTGSASLSDKMFISVISYALKQMKDETELEAILGKLEVQKAMVFGKGVASSSEETVNFFHRWLKTQGKNLDEAQNVMGKKIFIKSGQAQDPDDGNSIDWNLLCCFF